MYTMTDSEVTHLNSSAVSHTHVKTRSLVTITNALLEERVAGGRSAPLVFAVYGAILAASTTSIFPFSTLAEESV